MSSYRYKARPTIYNGIQMRSRLEAKFAAYMDSRGSIEWVYEKVCFASEAGQYLPDFHCVETTQSVKTGRTVSQTTWVEVKPASERKNWAAHLKRMHIIRASEPDAALSVAIESERALRGWEFITCIPSHPCEECMALDVFHHRLAGA